MAGSKVKITDKSSVKDWKTVYGKGKASVTVGVLDSKGGSAKAGDSNISLSELAAIHEFGLGGMPERSFIRSYFDIHTKDLIAMVAKLMAKAIAKATSSGKPITDEQRKSILGLVGAYAKGQIQARISNREIQPQQLAKATIARKGSDVALIDTGQLRASIDFEVKIDG